jgi:hypothetical protein
MKKQGIKTARMGIVRNLLLLALLVGAGVFLISSAGNEAAETQYGGPAALEVAAASYHIGIVTGSAAQAEDDSRGAEELVRRYGKDMIRHITFPDDFMDRQDLTISRIAALADDPLMKAIVVNQAVPGTAEAFRRIREKRPDIIVLAGEAHEDPRVIQSTADMAVNLDFISRGYLIPWAAKQMGAKTFVHISFPRHMSYESLGLRRQIMEAACKDLGLNFVFVSAPDPTSDVGMAGAQQFIMEQVPQWIQRYGTDAAFFCTNDAHTEPLIRQILNYGGIFVEADLPSPLLGYPGALGLRVPAKNVNFPAFLKKVEDAVVKKGGAGRFGVYSYSYGFTLSAGLGEFAKRIVEGTAKISNPADFYAALGEFTPGANWNGAVYNDANTGTIARNHLLIYMDTYIMGKPGSYLPTTKQIVPGKYYRIRFRQ